MTSTFKPITILIISVVQFCITGMTILFLLEPSMAKTKFPTYYNIGTSILIFISLAIFIAIIFLTKKNFHP